MKAYVRVAWIGPNLNHKFISNNTYYPGPHGMRSILIFHWWPSVLLEPFDFQSVAFSPCIDSSVVSNAVGCFALLDDTIPRASWFLASFQYREYKKNALLNMGIIF